MPATLIVHGKIGRDAEIRQAGNSQVSDLAIAYNYGKKDNDGKKPTQWVRGSLWGNYAATMQQYLTKGTSVYVVLKDVNVRTYAKNDGSAGVSLEGEVVTIEITARPQPAPGAAPPPPARAPARAPAPAPTRNASGFDDMDDDIPF
jgi:single-strand DNA-binding protein